MAQHVQSPGPLGVHSVEIEEACDRGRILDVERPRCVHCGAHGVPHVRSVGAGAVKSLQKNRFAEHRKPLVEPEARPVRARDHVTEPLVCEFV